jgi:hypothetical protein
MQGFAKMCDTCHRQEDIHAQSLGPQCGNCHTVRSFSPSFFTHTNVGFTLIGPHRLLSCKQCHTAGNYMGLSGECVSCHLDDAFRAAQTAGQAHNGFAAEPCLRCHNQVSWLLKPYLRRRF